MAFPGPYAAPRADVQTWAENGDAGAARWLEKHPAATHFGVDDGDIYVAFGTEADGARWQADMEADADEQAESRARTARRS
jgi:hypothetical protein